MAQKLPRDKAADMAEVNPQAALVFAVLDLAMAIRENGVELETIAKHHEQLATETASVAGSLQDLGREVAAASRI